ncbi:hypothetical protein ACXR6G_18400 [Ancylomarina sp. YFZ004]
MIPGPTLIIACPTCNSLSKKSSLLSGNTFLSTLWSDGIRISPMAPQNPELIKCKHCNNFDLLKDYKTKDSIEFLKFFERSVENIEDNSIDHYMKYIDVDFIKTPSTDEYFEALKQKNLDVKMIRFHIWRSFNNRFRRENRNELSILNQEKYRDNALLLIELLDKNDMHELISMAELYRNIGAFAESKSLILCLETEDMHSIKEQLLIEIENQNMDTITLE